MGRSASFDIDMPPKPELCSSSVYSTVPEPILKKTYVKHHQTEGTSRSCKEQACCFKVNSWTWAAYLKDDWLFVFDKATHLHFRMQVPFCVNNLRSNVKHFLTLRTGTRCWKKRPGCRNERRVPNIVLCLAIEMMVSKIILVTFLETPNNWCDSQ